MPSFFVEISSRNRSDTLVAIWLHSGCYMVDIILTMVAFWLQSGCFLVATFPNSPYIYYI